MLRKILFVLVAALTLSVGMRAEESVTLEQVAKQLNSECPVKGEDFTLDNVWLIGNRLEYHMSMSYPRSQNLAIEKKMKQIRLELLSDFAKDPDMRVLLQMIADECCNFDLWIHSTEDKLFCYFSILYTTQEIKNALRR